MKSFYLLLLSLLPLLLSSSPPWSYGQVSILPPPPTITNSYDSMVKNPSLQLVSLGLNNSALVNLSSTVVISSDPKYVDTDGVTGKISEKQNENNILTKSYEEMLRDQKKKIVLIGLNSTALKDSEGQVIVRGTGFGIDRDEVRETRETPVYYDGSERLKKNLSKKETIKKAGNVSIHAPNNNYQDYEQQIQRLREDLNNVNKSREELVLQNELLQKNNNKYYEEVQKEYPRKITKLNEEIERLQKQIYQNSDINENSMKLKRENELLANELKTLKMMKEGLENRISEMQRNNNHLENYQSGIEDLEHRIRNLESQLRLEKNNSDSQMLNLKILSDENNKLKNLNERLLSQIKEYEKKLEHQNYGQEKNIEKIALLSTEIERLQFQLKEKSKEISERSGDIRLNLQNELKEISEKYQEKIIHLEKEIELLKMKNTDLDNRNLDLRTKLENLQLSIPELIIENELWRKKTPEMERDLKKSSELNNEVSILKIALNEKDHEVERLKNKAYNNNEVNVLKIALNEKDQEAEKLKNRIYNLEQENSNNIYHVEKAKRAVQAANSAETETYKKLQQNCEELLTRITMLNQEGMRKNSEISQLEKKNRELTIENNNLQKIPIITEERKKELYQKIKDLENKAEFLISENQRLAELLDHKNKENEDLAFLLEQRNLELEKRGIEEKDFQIILSEKKDLELELMSCHSKVNELNRILMENEIQLRNHNNKTESIKRAANIAESDKREYEIKINNLFAENENLNKKIDQLQKNQMNTNDLKGKIDREWETRLAISENDRNRLQTQLKEKQKDIELLAANLSEMNKKVLQTTIIKENYNSDDEILKLSAEKASLEAVILRHEQKLKDFINQIEMLKKDDEKLQILLNEKSAENENIKNRFVALEGAQITEISELRKQIENMKKNNLDVREFNLQSEVEKTNYETRINTLQQEIQNKNFELDKAYELINKRKGELENKNREIEEIKHNISSKDSSYITFEINKMSSQLKQLVVENEDLRKAMNHYKLQCEKSNSEVMKKSHELSSKITDLDNLKVKLSRSPSSIRYVTPTPSTMRDNSQSQIKFGLNYNYDSQYT